MIIKLIKVFRIHQAIQNHFLNENTCLISFSTSHLDPIKASKSGYYNFKTIFLKRDYFSIKISALTSSNDSAWPIVVGSISLVTAWLYLNDSKVFGMGFWFISKASSLLVNVAYWPLLQFWVQLLTFLLSLEWWF